MGPQGPQGEAGISTHALREEGDQARIGWTTASTHFYPRPPRGGRPKDQLKTLKQFLFLPTPSARRATVDAAVLVLHPLDFYPRPPRGGRPFSNLNRSTSNLFLPTPSARRATTAKCNGDQSRNFYPRPPRGGRPVCKGLDFHSIRISTHALREEGDYTRRFA